MGREIWPIGYVITSSLLSSDELVIAFTRYLLKRLTESGFKTVDDILIYGVHAIHVLQ